jgi:nucleoside-diphosphate-sugar epimerase
LPPHASEQPQLAGLSKNGRLDQSNEISIQFYVGGSGKILGSFASVNRLKDGVPVEVVPEPHLPVMLEASHLVRTLASVGLRGPINLQGRFTSEGVRFFEINTRFTGITGVRAALGYREVEAGICDFFAEQEEEARRCLSFIPGLVAIRYVEDTIVPKELVELISKEETFSKNKRAERPARVLVTGASGYIGTNLIASLLNLPEIQEVRAGVRSDSAAARLGALFGDNSRLTPVIGELPFSPWSLEGIDVVIHLAALRPPVSLSPESGDLFLINAEGTRQLLEAMRQAGTAQLIFLSSQSVYGTKRRIPWSEMLPPRPETSYGLSKLVGEQLCFNNDIRTAILRASRTYGLGHGMRWEELPHKFAMLSARGKPLPVYGGGGMRVDLVHIQDLCDAIIKACSYRLRNSQPAIFNVGGGQPVTVMQLAHKCQSVAIEFGLPEPAIEYMESDKNDERNFGLEIRLARTHLDWAPAVSLEEGLRQLIGAEIRGQFLH